jgi:NADH-quinone oxidoreductase subunit I
VLTGVLEFHFEEREERFVKKEQLLAIGDRFEEQIATARQNDAAYR